MSESLTSDAARQLARARWGDTKPRKRVDQLAQQVAKLPAADRERLRQALDDAQAGGDAA
jgi:hypothetical protein